MLGKNQSICQHTFDQGWVVGITQLAMIGFVIFRHVYV